MSKSYERALGLASAAMVLVLSAQHCSTAFEGSEAHAPGGYTLARIDASKNPFVPARVTFEQIFFSKAKRGPAAYDDAFAALRAIHAGDGDPGRFGDAFVEGRWIKERSFDSLAAFGPTFYPENLPRGTWALFPIESPQGFHLVRVTEVEPAHAGRAGEERGPVAAR